jgi:catechol 2,3-dioxygenase-like lactoylglutathione lyase family enzyme
MWVNNKIYKTISIVSLCFAGEVVANCPTSSFPTNDALHITGRIHFAVNVEDFNTSREFYRIAGFTDQVGGFPETNTLEVSQGVGLDVPYRVKVELIYLGKLPEEPIDLTVPTGRFIDLVEWMEPARLESPYAEINHLGITYFSLDTTDLSTLIKDLESAGGSIVSGPLNNSSGDQLAMIRDPDGVFVRLQQSSSKNTEIDYLNINVSDLECSKSFYNMLGLELQPEELDSSDTDLYHKTLGLDDDTNIERKEAMLTHRVDKTKIKLNQWIVPTAPGAPYLPPINHLGIQRLNWASTNLEADVAVLKSHGIKFLSKITPCCEGDASTFGFILFEDPDGIYNQLMGPLTPKAKRSK